DLGTAVNIQSMVFGNMGKVAGTGVLFTRSPSSGKKQIYGEFLPNAQGEDIVSGTRTPYPIFSESEPEKSMHKLMPELYKELQEVADLLEKHYLDMQDIEFTIENGRLYILQTRSGKRTSSAAISIAVDMVKNGMITKEQALLRVDAESLSQMLHPRIDDSCKLTHVGQGLAASPGAASGMIVLSPYDAEEFSHHHKVILVRTDTSPEDIHGMYVSEGILTARGGMTSHAAVVARGMGKPCICGATSVRIDEKQGLVHIGDVTIKKGDVITIDGDSGRIFIGDVPTVVPEFTPDFGIFMSWVDEFRKLEVRANAETVLDVETSLRLGAEGVGLCRTEHMFFEPEKIALMREMIVAPTNSLRQIALDKLLPLHKEDFKNIFRAMNGKPVNVRLIDPPLHEFLPSGQKEKLELAKSLNLSLDDIDARLHALHEVNPMLGHRGCRLGITYPQIYAMQLEALIIAAIELEKESGIITDLEIMMPLVADKAELSNLRLLAENVIIATQSRMGGSVKFQIGTMIELPRACLQAREIAEIADYFSFGTNDLTQTTYGISRDDVASFLPYYMEKKIIESDPFSSIDKKGVGQLIKMAVEGGRETKKNLKIGVCGEHGGDPSSIDFFSKLGMNYVSCSPYRVPIARLAAAQSVVKK
nr:pyruvate, phosphate dikinase [Rickettsiaceae bacterium]